MTGRAVNATAAVHGVIWSTTMSCRAMAIGGDHRGSRRASDHLSGRCGPASFAVARRDRSPDGRQPPSCRDLQRGRNASCARTCGATASSNRNPRRTPRQRPSYRAGMPRHFPLVDDAARPSALPSTALLRSMLRLPTAPFLRRRRATRVTTWTRPLDMSSWNEVTPPRMSTRVSTGATWKSVSGGSRTGGCANRRTKNLVFWSWAATSPHRRHGAASSGLGHLSRAKPDQKDPL